jgi:N-acetylmuramate 1-kinase
MSSITDFAPLAETAPRQQAMRRFIDENGWRGVMPRPLSADASFRTYYRLAGRRGSAVLMDAPPPNEQVEPYIAVAALLRGLGFSAPRVMAEDRAHGFLLIEDFGDDTYTRLLARGADEEALYGLAVDTLIALHGAVAAEGVPELPPYDEARLLAEAALLADWYYPAVIGAPLDAAAREDYLASWRRVLREVASSPPTLVLRDYHVDNLMLLAGRAGVRGCGLLDFQDAVIGSPAYDLVSLIEDARRDVPRALRERTLERYLAAFPRLGRALFRRSAAILAAQRNAKIIGIFTRLMRRDGKPHYLPHIPRVWRLLEEDLREPVLAPVARWLDRHLPPAARRTPDPAPRR